MGFLQNLATHIRTWADARYPRTNDSRLSDARTPLPHTHGLSDVSGIPSMSGNVGKMLTTNGTNLIFKSFPIFIEWDYWLYMLTPNYLMSFDPPPYYVRIASLPIGYTYLVKFTLGGDMGLYYLECSYIFTKYSNGTITSPVPVNQTGWFVDGFSYPEMKIYSGDIVDFSFQYTGSGSYGPISAKCFVEIRQCGATSY